MGLFSQAHTLSLISILQLFLSCLLDLTLFFVVLATGIPLFMYDEYIWIYQISDYVLTQHAWLIILLIGSAEIRLFSSRYLLTSQDQWYDHVELSIQKEYMI